MILIFGGAYQGKTAYALQTFDRQAQDVFRCGRDGHIDWTKSVIAGLENFVWSCAQQGIEAKEVLAPALARLAEAEPILIACDVSQGLVPMDPLERAYREMMGRTLLYLASEATAVHRVFCGLGQQLK